MNKNRSAELKLGYMEQLLVPYKAKIRIEGKKVLVLAPHPDDEVFGCGGAIMRHVAAGNVLQVNILSDGEYRVESDQQAAYGELRRMESIKAAAILGYGTPVFWGLPDRGIEYGELLVKRILNAITSFDADLIYAPSIYEMHPDHRSLGMAALEAVRRKGCELNLAMYEVGVPMLRPNLMLDISELQERKQQAMACFASQLSEQPYDQHITALNRFRTYTLGPSVTTAEAYFLVNADELNTDILNLYEPEYRQQHKIGLSIVSADAPLVSVLIRSMDRPHLQDTLDSLALQTYANIEVIIINAQAQAHRSLGSWCGRFPLRVVNTGTPLMRSRAANVGLDNATGDYLIFLDDDDWWSPNQVSGLVDALKNNPTRYAAYSGAEYRCENRGKVELPPFNGSFEAGRLRGENFIPIHTIMFARKLLEKGARFDETFPVYEDWDFLLQLAQLTEFTHVPEIRAYYRLGGESGVFTGNQMTHQGREQIFEKWKTRWTGAQIDGMVRAKSTIAIEHVALLRAELDQSQTMLTSRDLKLNSLEKDIAELGQNIDELKSQLFAKDEVIESKDYVIQTRDARLHDVFASKSWRLSAPIRSAGRISRGAKRRIKKSLRRVLGMTAWPNGAPETSQGFAGEELIPPTANTSEPLISVIMPVYNACRVDKAYFLSALESIANQTYKNIELIIVDDGCTDDTKQVCSDFLKQHPELRAHYLTKENGGQSSARNFGVLACSGEYVGFIDQDDEWYENKLEQVVPWLSNKDIDVLYTDADIIDGDDNVLYGKIHGVHRFGWPHPKKVIEDILFKDIIVMPGLMTIKKSAFELVEGFDENLSGYEDDDLFLRLFEKCKIFYLPTPTLRWRMYGDNYSFSYRMLKSRSYYWKKLLKNHTSNETDIFKVKMISLRFFWQFMNQALEQHRAGNDLYIASLKGAREIAPYLPKAQRVFFALGFSFPDKYAMPIISKVDRLFRSISF